MSRSEPAFWLAALNDEIAPTFDKQLDLLVAQGIGAVELRSLFGKNVLDLDAAEVERARAGLRERGLRVTCIASPIGKETLADARAQPLARFERAARLAHAFAAPAVRIFSFYVAPDEADVAREEVLARLGALARAAERAGLMLLHENERGIWGDTPARCLDLLQTIASPALRCLFDPANFVGVGVARPFDEAYPLLAHYLAHVHIKDARRDPATGRTQVLPAGQGDGQLRELLAALWQRGWQGVLALEPHLASGGPLGGYTGPELFATAVTALRDTVAAAGAHFEAG